MYLTNSLKYEKNLFARKNIPYKIEKNLINKIIFFLNFTFGSEYFVKIDWFLVEM